MTYKCEMLPLEPRRFLNGAGFASLTSRGTLLVAGTAAGNEISVSFDDNLGLAVATHDGDSQSFPASAVKRIRVEAGGGNDRVAVSGPRSCTIVGGAGNDTLNAGRRDDSLDGGAGDDVMDGGAGNDFIGGGDGFDTADYFSREVGFEFLFDVAEDGEPPPEPFTEQTPYGSATSAPASQEIDTIGYFVEAVAGTSHPDEFHIYEIGNITRLYDGRGSHDFFNITSGDSDDSVSEMSVMGGGGNDYFLTDQRVHDTIFAGQGDDWIAIDGLTFQGFPEALDGGSGRDTIGFTLHDYQDLDLRLYPSVEDVRVASIDAALGPSDSQVVTIIGNELPNHINAADYEFRVRVFGMGGNDTLEGANRADALFGGEGDDLLIGGLGNDTLRGEGGNDVLGGNGGNDVLLGHAGNDNLYGADGNDRIDGGTGADTFTGGRGNDVLFTRDTIAESVNGGLGTDAAQADENLDALFSVEDSLA